MLDSPKTVFGLLLLVCLNLLSVQAFAQSDTTSESNDSIELLESRIQEIEASGELDETNTAVLDLYRKSISQIEQRRSYEASTAKFVESRESAPKQAAALRKQIAQLEAKAVPKLSKSLPDDLPTMQQLLLDEKAELTKLRAELAELETLLASQMQRTQLARERLNAVTRRQLVIADELQSVNSAGESPRLVEARRWALEFETRTLSAEIEMLNQELLSQPMRIKLIGIQRDLATLRVNRKLDYVELLNALVSERRLSVAETVREKADETERQTFGKHPLVQQLARENTQLGEELNKLATRLEAIFNEENKTIAEAKDVTDNYRLARQKLDIAGLNQSMGQVLLEQRRSLPDSSDFKAAEARLQRLLIESGLRQIRNQQERAKLRDINEYVEQLMAPLSETWRNLLQDEVLGLAEIRRDLLDRAIATDDAYLQALGELDFAQQQLSESVSTYNKFLDERLLWIRTGEPPSWETLSSVYDSIAVFISLEHWLEVAQALVFPASFPWVLLTGIALFTVLMVKMDALRALMMRNGRNVGQLRRDRFRYSIKALLLTIVMALPWPILFAALGMHLQQAQGTPALDLNNIEPAKTVWNGQFASAIGAAFNGIAFYAFCFIAFRIFCSRDGLALTHFGWSVSTVRQLRYNIRRLMVVFLPSTFVLIASITYEPAALADGLSRLFFVLVLTALAWFFGRILNPQSGALCQFYASNPSNPLTWLRYLWLLLGLSLPIILAVLATLGYVYTAAQFGGRLVDTLWLVVIITLIHQLVVRWLTVTERRLAFHDALERRRQQRAARGLEQARAGAEEPEPLPLEEPKINFQALGEDTTKLINAILTLFAAFGLWWIWSGVFPAFRILDDFSLWSYVSVVDGKQQLVPVTLNNLILGLLAVLLVVIAARRLPGLLEIVLLARINISAGSRYTIVALTQYAIIAAGVMLVFNLLGGNWSEIQWLIAALGVGIGFGLQEIVANLICGLILLFERPIRIGDTVTVGDTNGVITKIRIRSTTIRTWDQKELIVPNKEFVTGRLLNWTLTDPVTRLVIPVGIAYSSDVALAIRLVQQVADENERVIEEPPPLVTFENFSDNSLVIMLRCFIGSMEYRHQITSELNLAINQKFKEAGIVIAFPQRDIHLDTSSPLEVRIHPMPG